MLFLQQDNLRPTHQEEGSLYLLRFKNHLQTQNTHGDREGTMKCHARITVEAKDQQENILRLFAVEDKELSNKRASYTIKKDVNTIIFDVKADDTIAFRAIISAITKTLSVFEKAKQTIEQM